MIFWGVVLFCGGCETGTTHKGEVISVNPHEAEEFVNLSEIADSIKIIRLQTEGDDVIGRVSKIMIKKKYIYVQDVSQMIVFVFDREGKYVSKLNKRGKGAGEYLFYGPAFIDDNEEYMELVDFSGKKIFKYSNISFEFIEETPFPYVKLVACSKHENFYYCTTQQQDNVINGIETNAELVIVDDQNSVKTLFDKTVETNNHYYTMNTENFTKNDKDELFLSPMFDNTFYRLSAGEAYPIFTIDFGKYGMNNSYVGSLSTQKQMQYIEDMRGLAAFPSLDINNSDIMAISYFFKQKKGRFFAFDEDDYRLYLKFKETDKVFHVKQIKNDLSTFPNRICISTSFSGCAHEAWYEDYLVDIVVPEIYFKEPTDKVFVEGIGEITADDDPIVVMIKLRK